MSKRTMTKFNTFIVASALAVSMAFTFVNYNPFNNTSLQTQLLSACMAEQSNLPMNHINHPCHGTYMSNKSWWSLISGDSPSAHFFYLDLVELIQQSLH